MKNCSGLCNLLDPELKSCCHSFFSHYFSLCWKFERAYNTNWCPARSSPNIFRYFVKFVDNSISISQPFIFPVSASRCARSAPTAARGPCTRSATTPGSHTCSTTPAPSSTLCSCLFGVRLFWNNHWGRPNTLLRSLSFKGGILRIFSDCTFKHKSQMRASCGSKLFHDIKRLKCWDVISWEQNFRSYIVKRCKLPSLG